LKEEDKARLIAEIKEDFDAGLKGIQRLPVEAKLGVYTAYVYYRRLLTRLERTPSAEIRNTRIRVPNYEKIGLLAKGYVSYRLNLI
jgi:phytoene/squalene synthetase